MSPSVNNGAIGMFLAKNREYSHNPVALSYITLSCVTPLSMTSFDLEKLPHA